jgi:hypothetical protein
MACYRAGGSPMNAGHHVEWMKELCRIMEGRGMAVIGYVTLQDYFAHMLMSTTASVLTWCHIADYASGKLVVVLRPSQRHFYLAFIATYCHRRVVQYCLPVSLHSNHQSDTGSSSCAACDVRYWS